MPQGGMQRAMCIMLKMHFGDPQRMYWLQQDAQRSTLIGTTSLSNVISPDRTSIKNWLIDERTSWLNWIRPSAYQTILSKSQSD